MLNRLYLIIAGVLTALVGLGALYRQGVKHERQRQEWKRINERAKAQAKTLENQQNAQDVANEVAGSDPDDVRDRLRDKWTRDN